jgi:hypothetical protein
LRRPHLDQIKAHDRVSRIAIGRGARDNEGTKEEEQEEKERVTHQGRRLKAIEDGERRVCELKQGRRLREYLDPIFLFFSPLPVLTAVR